MSRWQRMIISIGLVGLACAAQAVPAGAENTPRDHAGGFFLRLAAGAGGASSEIDTDGNDVKFSGPAGDVNIAIGGMVARNLALHGTIFGWTVGNPDVEVNGRTFDTDDTEFSMSALGGGLTYYFMPVNLYLSGSLGVGSLTADGSEVDGESDPGIAADFSVGKEWWVSNRWGLGIAGAVDGHSVKDDKLDENWSGPAFTLRFSATFN